MVPLAGTAVGSRSADPPLDVVAYTAPPREDALTGARGGGQPWICILTEAGAHIECRIRTEPQRFTEILGPRPLARIRLEASTEREWVARCLEALGHEVVVADPNCAPMSATRTRKVKTDRRDARALPEACLLGAYRPAHRRSDAQRHGRGRLAVRDAVGRTEAPRWKIGPHSVRKSAVG